MRRVFFSIMLLSAAVIIAGCGKKEEAKDKDAEATSATTLEANQVRLDVTGMS